MFPDASAGLERDLVCWLRALPPLETPSSQQLSQQLHNTTDYNRYFPKSLSLECFTFCFFFFPQ